MSAAALTREISDAGRGVARLIRYDPRWTDSFDPTVGGFLRSFFAPVLALPFLIVVTALLQPFTPDAHGPRELWGVAIAQLTNAVAYPVVLGLLARPLDFGAGYSGFIVVVNWSNLFAAVATAGAAALLPLGGLGLFGFIWLAVFAASLFVIWRAARETLARDVAPALLAVVLWVGLGALTDHLGDWIVSLVAP